MIHLHIPSQLENDQAILLPLQDNDFDSLYAVAADPKIWEQHPQTDRWKESTFRAFFESAINSRGAFKIIDKTSGSLAGSTRFYDYDSLRITMVTARRGASRKKSQK